MHHSKVKITFRLYLKRLHSIATMKKRTKPFILVPWRTVRIADNKLFSHSLPFGPMCTWQSQKIHDARFTATREDFQVFRFAHNYQCRECHFRMCFLSLFRILIASWRIHFVSEWCNPIVAAFSLIFIRHSFSFFSVSPYLFALPLMQCAISIPISTLHLLYVLWLEAVALFLWTQFPFECTMKGNFLFSRECKKPYSFVCLCVCVCVRRHGKNHLQLAAAALFAFFTFSELFVVQFSNREKLFVFVCDRCSFDVISSPCNIRYACDWAFAIWKRRERQKKTQNSFSMEFFSCSFDAAFPCSFHSFFFSVWTATIFFSLIFQFPFKRFGITWRFIQNMWLSVAT